MRTVSLAFLLAMLIVMPADVGATSEVTTMQEGQPEDPRQPNANSTTLRMYHDGLNQANAWSHFNDNDTTSADLYGEWRNNTATIDINMRFSMTPKLTKRLNITADSEFRGSFLFDLEGWWTTGESGSPCTVQAPCENLNISLVAGGYELVKQEYPDLVQGENRVTFNWRIPESVNWNGQEDNPEVIVTMKLKSDRSQSWGVLQSGRAAHFIMYMGNSSFVEIPVDEGTWDSGFQAYEDPVVEENTPGFTGAVAIMAVTMAAIASRVRTEDSDE